MTRANTPQEIHQIFEAAVNRQDLDDLVALYTPDAVMVQPDGSLATGHDAIRRHFVELLATDGQMAVRTLYAVEAGDLALLSCEWTLTIGDETRSSVTAEVARRQSDSSWLYVLDHPFTSLQPAVAAGSQPGTATSTV